MIQKIREMMQVSEQIDGVQKLVSQNHESVSRLSEEIRSVNSELRCLKSTHEELMDEIRKEHDEIRQIRESLSRELYEFHLLKGMMQDRMLERFEKELSSKLSINLESLKSQSNEYSNLKKDVAAMFQGTKELASEISKLSQISKNIKREDFELTKYCSRIWDMDREKLELMRKVDNLERLVSKLRRSGSQDEKRRKALY